MSRRNQRGAIRRSFTKLYKELKDELDKDGPKNEELISSLWTKLEDRSHQLSKIDDDIMNELCEQNVSAAEMDEEYESIQEYRDKWNELVSTGKFTRQIEHSQSADSAVESRTEKSRYKLPKLKLVEFTGCPREWLSFWSQFKGIHENELLSSEEKFQYLIQATVAESAARRVVSSFPPTAENYGKAIAHLKSRFGKENVLVEVYVRDLLKVVLANTNGQQKLPLATLYDKLETQLRSLESLGVTSDKYAAMLYPLVESSISQDVLIVWERIRNQRYAEVGDDEDQLKQLMTFLRGEVESSIRLEMDKRSVTSEDESEGPPIQKRRMVFESATTSDLLSKSSVSRCIFCEKGHQSQHCVNVDKLKMSERFSKIRMARRCFKCLNLGHFAWNCKASLKCPLCDGNHYKMLCTKDEKKPLNEINAFSAYDDGDIMQTLLLNVSGPSKRQAVRTLLDGGSGRSYISSPAVKNFELQPIGSIDLAHSLFGGHVTKFEKHSVYEIDVSNTDNTFQKRYQLIEVEKICSAVDPVRDGPWITELRTKGVQLSDLIEKQCPIHMLLANVISKLYTGKIYETGNGPVAFETKFGWVLTGAVEIEKTFSKSTVLLVHTMFVNTASIQDLWNLDIIGIHDPVQEKSRED